MATPDEQWWDAQAGEYVLGTLQRAERDVFESILKVDAEARERVAFWENTFSIFDKNIHEIAPPEYIFPKILASIQDPKDRNIDIDTPIDHELSGTDEGNNEPSQIEPQASSEHHSTSPPTLATTRRRRSSKRSNKIWKSVAGLATAASVAFAAVLMNNLPSTSIPKTQEINSIAIIQNENQQPLWIINVNAETRTAQTIAIAPPEIEANQTHQLWIVKPDNAGVISVGLLPRTTGLSITLALTTDTLIAPVFAVSLEPQGGSPESVPTGPVQFTGSAVLVNNVN